MVDISVIIPVYNVEKYLDECLNSVLAQDYGEYEVILINDGSTDKSLEIAESYLESFGDKLSIYSQQNSGISAARNLGIEKAAGKYLYFLDSDDMIVGTTFSKCIKIFNEKKCDVIFFDADVIYNNEDNINIEDYKHLVYERMVDDGVYKSTNLFKIFLKKRYIVQPCCYMLKKESYASIRFPEGLLHEDNYYTTKVLCEGNNFAYVLKEKLFIRRFRPGSIMTSIKTNKHADGYFCVARLLHKENGKMNDVNVFCLNLFEQGVDTLARSEGLNLLAVKFNMIKESLNYGVGFKVMIKIINYNLFLKLKRLLSHN